LITDGVNPVTPDDVSVVGDTVTVEVPSGGGTFDVDLVDRFGNAFPTQQVTANATWDLRTLTPFDFADIFLNTLTGTYTAGEEQAIIDFVNDLHLAGIWQRRRAIFPFAGANAFDNSLNLKYPFDNGNSNRMRFVGSPTHNSNGVTFSATSAGFIEFPIGFLPINDKNFFIYSRTNNLPTGGAFDIGTSTLGTTGQTHLAIRDDNTDRSIFAWDGVFAFNANNTDSRGGYHTNNVVGTNLSKAVKNGDTATPMGVMTAGVTVQNSNINIGGQVTPQLTVSFPTSRNYAGFAVGLSLSDTQMQDDYDIWQQFQTDFNGRQV
jgi:hypothetical protein